MPKAFLLKKKISMLSALNAQQHHSHNYHHHQQVVGSPKSSLFSPSSSSGIGSPGSPAESSASSSSSSSSNSIIVGASESSLSPRRMMMVMNDNNENENRFENTVKYPFEKNENQGLDLSVKSLLKESNNAVNSISSCSSTTNPHTEHSTFVSSYPYPAKFAKIADFLRNTTEAASNNNGKNSALNPLAHISDALNKLETSSSSKKSQSKPMNYSTGAINHQHYGANYNHQHQRTSPYSINWSEHFSVNQISVSSPATSQRSADSDSGRESFHSSDDIASNDTNSQTESSSPSNSDNNGKNGKKSDRYHCTDCNKSYSTQSGLAKHQEFLCATQVKKSFSCKHCEKVYVSLGALKMHIRTHTLPCKCKLCGKAFSRPWLLQGHIRTHTGEKPFACQFCSRAFADRSNLRAHLQTHSVVKKYSCKNCSRTFSRMSLLLKHEDNGCGANRSTTSSSALQAKSTTPPTMNLVPIQV